MVRVWGAEALNLTLTESAIMKSQITDEKITERPILFSGPMVRADYEQDVREADAAVKANPSSMNHEDLIAAKRALRRHFPN